MTKPKEAINKMWESGFFRTSYKSTKDVAEEAFKIYHCTYPNWYIILQRSRFLRKDEKGWIQKEEYSSKENRNICLITGNKPWTDRNDKFVEFVNKLSGEILILDQYYGIDTFHILSKFPKSNKIRFLSSQLGKDENEVIIKKEITRFKKEFKNIKMRLYQNFYELHDRYIISDNMFIIVGHGLKDLGNKECFLIGLPVNEVDELTSNLKNKFEDRWNKANILF